MFKDYSIKRKLPCAQGKIWVAGCSGIHLIFIKKRITLKLTMSSERKGIYKQRILVFLKEYSWNLANATQSCCLPVNLLASCTQVVLSPPNCRMSHFPLCYTHIQKFIAVTCQCNSLFCVVWPVHGFSLQLNEVGSWRKHGFENRIKQTSSPDCRKSQIPLNDVCNLQPQPCDQQREQSFIQKPRWRRAHLWSSLN